LVPPDWREARQRLAQLDVDRVIEIGIADVEESSGLLLHRLHDLGMTVTGRDRRDPRGEVEESVPIHVLDDHALGPPHDQRHVLAQVLRHGPGVPRDELAGLRARERCGNLRVFAWIIRRERRSAHGVPPEGVILTSCARAVKDGAPRTPRAHGRSLTGPGRFATIPVVLLRRAFPLLLMALLFAGCGESARPNVLLIIFDTAR